MSDGLRLQEGSSRTALLRVLGTTDIHVHLLAYDYYSNTETPGFGLSQTSVLIDRYRDSATNSVLLDNGDFLQGSPLSDYIAFETGFQRGDLHPAIAAMNALGFDAATLGNHEFNFGLEFLRNVLDHAGFPIVSANVLLEEKAHDGSDRHFVDPWSLIDLDIRMDDGSSKDLKLGVIGFAPPLIVDWDKQHLQSRIWCRDIVESAKIEVPRLREAGADIVVALCHSGIGPERHTVNMENAAIPLSEIDGIDAIFAGHTHRVFPGAGFGKTEIVDPVAGTIHGKPVVEPGFHGSHLGVIDLSLIHDDAGWRVAGHDVQVTSAASERGKDVVGTDYWQLHSPSKVIEAVAEFHKLTLNYLRNPLGVLDVPLQTYFTLVAPDRTVPLLAEAQASFARRLMADSPQIELPIVSAVAPFKAGGWAGPKNYVDIPEGELTLRHAAELYLFPNTVAAVEITGAEALDWLERSAGLFHQITPGAPARPLIRDSFAPYNFDIFDGLTYVIDPTAPPRYGLEGELLDPEARRILNARYQGRPLDPDEKLVVVTNSYRTGGGGSFRAAKSGRVVMSTSISARDVLVDYIREAGTVAPQSRPSWSLKSLPGTTALFYTGPKAQAHMPPDFEFRRTTEAGFAEFEIAL